MKSGRYLAGIAVGMMVLVWVSVVAANGQATGEAEVSVPAGVDPASPIRLGEVVLKAPGK